MTRHHIIDKKIRLYTNNHIRKSHFNSLSIFIFICR